MKKGYLVVHVYGDSIANPVSNAMVTVSKKDEIIEVKQTDKSGETASFTLDTVDKVFSEEEQYEVRPYEVYDVTVEAMGMTKTKIEGVQIFDEITSFQDIYLTSIDEELKEQVNEISENTLWEEHPENNIEEESEKQQEITPYVLDQVLIPEMIVVHDGIPNNTNAPNYNVPFVDYIKNVASSEIYSTWPKETIKANVLAILSFTLNRIYTEWYPAKGYSFTITSTTTYDQKYTRNGTIFEPISKVVDEIFNQYIRSGFRIEPLLAHYKNSTTEKGYLSQWGSKDLGDKGYSSLEILKYYYGNTIHIYEAETTQNYPYSFKQTLKEGSCSTDVYILQNTLNYIRGSYPKIPVIKNPTGVFDRSTKEAVKEFQTIFNLTPNGEANYQTWYRISYIFTAVSKMTNSIYE